MIMKKVFLLFLALCVSSSWQTACGSSISAQLDVFVTAHTFILCHHLHHLRLLQQNKSTNPGVKCPKYYRKVALCHTANVGIDPISSKYKASIAADDFLNIKVVQR